MSYASIISHISVLGILEGYKKFSINFVLAPELFEISVLGYMEGAIKGGDAYALINPRIICIFQMQKRCTKNQ